MKTLTISLKIFLLLTVLTGVIYPLIITGVAQFLFPQKANGSIITRNGKTIGSSLIGQQFDSSIYFITRPSAINYNPLPSGGSNYGPTNHKLKTQFNERMQYFITFNKLDSLTKIPSEMMFASASGLDPHISPQAAFLQVDRIVISRKFDKKQKLIQLIKNQTEQSQFLILGEKRVNVLLLNLELDKL